MYLIIDIETIPNDRINAYLRDKQYKPAANLKDPEKIEASIKNQRQKDHDKAGLYWWTGQIICLSCSNIDGTITKSFWGSNERTLLTEFLTYLSDTHTGAHLIGKSSADFDIPFIIGRCLVHDTGLTQHFRKYRELSDIDQIFSFSRTCGQVSSLADYAFGLDIGGKLSHGSHVQSMYNDTLTDPSRWTDIVEYCKQDVEITREILARYEKVFAVTSEEGKSKINMSEIF